MVTLMYRQNGKWLRGVWDSVERVPMRQEEGEEDEPAHPEWGIGEWW